MNRQNQSGFVGYGKMLDLHIYEETREENVLPWQYFTRDFKSIDTPYDELVKLRISANIQKKIDFRPYMIPSPFIVYTSDPLPKVLDIFRLHNLRHLIVIDENSREIAGMITR